MKAAIKRRSLFFVFTLSGFAGLIYESIWSHYLKLMLGHAAYAQTLVLVLFMGGMALGAAGCSRISARLSSPLMAYAGVELLLALFAFGFDPLFRLLLGWLLETAAPALASAWAIEALKWGLAAALILPACVLLGATFPLISAGVLRLDPKSAGNALGWLYFTNSLGAVAGVLTSGFLLIGMVGLPGTLMTAGLCNALLAITVYALSKGADESVPVTNEAQVIATIGGPPPMEKLPVQLLLATAFLTGSASFFYEIGWIRMLSLVLGSATHSFELMLGAFILGLALGALYIRNHIDTVREPLRLLAWVQVLMGTAALGTLVIYGWSFEWMGAIVRTLTKTDTGYAWFNLLSQGICCALMLPVTFFAGMTLPLITALLLRQGGGEAAVGTVYAANTWGAIAGIVLAVNLVMPVAGLRNVVVAGAVIDLGLGLWLLTRAGLPQRMPARLALAGMVLVAIGITVTLRFDVGQLASGVYRDGYSRRTGEFLWRRDGKTASIDVMALPASRHIMIMTNGKPDASLRSGGTSEDDFAQILMGLMPLVLRPDAREVAVVGMGSGRLTHVLLGFTTLSAVHTIEIEPAMVEGARLFGPLVERTFRDPRSRIHLEDAKTYFARHQQRYDAIVSEPSNPWVSGVASLFSQEFYAQAKRHLNPNGVFVQWLQMYEFDDALFASVIQALGSEFSDYAIYATDDSNVLIAAVPEGRLPAFDTTVLKQAGVKPLAESIGVRVEADLQIRRIGTRRTVDPWVLASRAPVNSDYFPFLDQNAGRERFKQGIAVGLSAAHPVLHRLEDSLPAYGLVSGVGMIQPTLLSQQAHGLWAYLEWKHADRGAGTMPPHAGPVVDIASRLDLILGRCEGPEVERVWIPTIDLLGQRLWPYMARENAGDVTTLLRKHTCKGDTADLVNRWLDYLDSVSGRNWPEVVRRSGTLLEGSPAEMPPGPFVYRELLLAELMQNGPQGVRRRVQEYRDRLPQDPGVRYLRQISGAG